MAAGLRGARGRKTRLVVSRATAEVERKYAADNATTRHLDMAAAAVVPPRQKREPYHAPKPLVLVRCENN